VKQKLIQHLLRNFINMTVHQAAALIIYSHDCIDSAELVQICEKVIAASLGDLSKELGGTTYILQIYKGFL
jgi:hypothetical protein